MTLKKRGVARLIEALAIYVSPCMPKQVHYYYRKIDWTYLQSPGLLLILLGPWVVFLIWDHRKEYEDIYTANTGQKSQYTTMVSRCFPGGYNVKLYISRGRLAWWLLAFLHSVTTMLSTSKNVLFPGHIHLLTTGADDPTLWHSVDNQSVGSSAPVVRTWK